MLVAVLDDNMRWSTHHIDPSRQACHSLALELGVFLTGLQRKEKLLALVGVIMLQARVKCLFVSFTTGGNCGLLDFLRRNFLRPSSAEERVCGSTNSVVSDGGTGAKGKSLGHRAEKS